VVPTCRDHAVQRVAVRPPSRFLVTQRPAPIAMCPECVCTCLTAMFYWTSAPLSTDGRRRPKWLCSVHDSLRAVARKRPPPPLGRPRVFMRIGQHQAARSRK